MTSRIRVSASLAVVLVLACAGCKPGSENAGAAENGDEETAPVPVEVQPVTRGDVYDVYSGTAALEADEEAVVVAKVSGEVEALLAEEGDTVAEGQVLARLDGDRLRLEMERSRANLKKLEQEYERNVQLYERGLVSSGAFEEVKYELDALRAAYELARLELSYSEIRAPIAGVVSARHIKVGNTIAVGDPVFDITDMDPLLADLFVPEREFRRLRPGQSAELLVDAIPDQSFEANILRVSPVVDPETGTFKVTMAVHAVGNRLKPGMFGRFRIIYDARVDALLVPRIALVENELEKAVFVVEDGVAQRRVVRTGYSRGERVEVLEGLEGDESVITIGQTGLKDGAAVRVITPAAG